MTDNDVVVRLLVRDDGSVELKKFQAQVAATKAEVSGLGGEGNALGRLFDSLDGKTGNLSNQMLGLNRSLASASSTVRHDLLYGLRDLTLGLTAAAGAATYFGLKAVDSFQHTQAAFSVLTGSMQNGKVLYNQLMALNLKSPFDMQPLASSAQTLLGFGFTGQNVLPLLKNISNVASVQQDPNEALQRMALAVGQINQSGVVRAQDMNQLVQAGLPAYSLIPGGHQALAAGHTISSQQFIAQLSDPNNASLQRYGGAASAMNQTLSGQLSNLKTEVRQTAIGAFSPMANELIKEMPHLTKTLQGMTKDLAPEIASFGMDLIKGAEAILPVLEPIVKSLLSGIDELAKSGGPFLRELQNVDPQVTAALDNLFMTLAAEEPALAGIFGDLLQVLPLFIDDLAVLLKLADPLLKMLDTFLGFKPVADIMGGLLVGLLAYKTLSGPIGMILKMTGALEGLTKAEVENAIVSKETGGIGGMGGMGGGKLGKLGRLAAGLGIAIPAAMDARGNWGVGDDVSALGGGAMAGSTFGPLGALFGAAAGGGFSLGETLQRHFSGGSGGSAGMMYMSKSLQLAAAHDAGVQRALRRDHASINMSTGAITIHAAPGMDETVLTQRVIDALDNWMYQRQARD